LVRRALARTWNAGDEVLVTQLEHGANYTPWVLAAADAVYSRYFDSLLRSRLGFVVLPRPNENNQIARNLGAVRAYKGADTRYAYVSSDWAVRIHAS